MFRGLSRHDAAALAIRIDTAGRIKKRPREEGRINKEGSECGFFVDSVATVPTIVNSRQPVYCPEVQQPRQPAP